MNRKRFIRIFGLSTLTPVSKLLASIHMEPQEFIFKDDGKIPNSKYPLLLYRNAFQQRGTAGGDWLENQFARENWTNSWRNGIYSYHHYHSTSHEVLGVYSGEALVHLGGEAGEKIKVQAGDIIVIPAGVGHKNLGSKNLGVVGAYPEGRSWDLNRGEPGERPRADENIAALPIPKTDPLKGNKGLVTIWK
ncbi:MAG TPA: cupin domain-containing protein [Cyclobacteriaceae bacterium]|nr:cupin domain-containing protein [Cyclobacteriaceae bacterium]